jgi:hypothetical protein
MCLHEEQTVSSGCTVYVAMHTSSYRGGTGAQGLRGQRAEGRGQRAEGRGQRAEGRGQRAEEQELGGRILSHLIMFYAFWIDTVYCILLILLINHTPDGWAILTLRVHSFHSHAGRTNVLLLDFFRNLAVRTLGWHCTYSEVLCKIKPVIL